MSLTGKLIRFACWRAAKRFDAAADDPVATQKALLQDLVQRNSGTDYGRRYGFGSVRSFADYQRQVPIVTYDDIAGEIDRIVAGERNVLTAEPGHVRADQRHHRQAQADPRGAEQRRARTRTRCGSGSGARATTIRGLLDGKS